MSLPIGIYSAVRQYSIGDYVFTFLGFLGLAIPNFILALVLMYVALQFWARASAGCSRPNTSTRPGAGQVVDLLAHLWIPIIVIGTTGTAALIRIMRANLPDELHKPYVDHRRAPRACPSITAAAEVSGADRAQPVRLDDRLGAARARSPASSSSRSCSTCRPPGRCCCSALISQDMYLAGGFILLMCVLTLIGMLISDILLAVARSAHPVQTDGAHDRTSTASAETDPSITPTQAGDKPSRVGRRRAVAADLAQVRPPARWRWSPGGRHPASISIALFAEFLAPTLPMRSKPQFTYAPPQSIALLRHRCRRQLALPAACHGLHGQTVDPAVAGRTFTRRRRARSCRSASSSRATPYKLWGLIPMNTAPHRPARSRATRSTCSAPTGSAATCSAG